jgi:hypothetical protein
MRRTLLAIVTAAVFLFGIIGTAAAAPVEPGSVTWSSARPGSVTWSAPQPGSVTWSSVTWSR